MNIRPITPAPSAVAFEGQKTKKALAQKPRFSKTDQEALKELLKLDSNGVNYVGTKGNLEVLLNRNDRKLESVEVGNKTITLNYYAKRSKKCGTIPPRKLEIAYTQGEKTVQTSARAVKRHLIDLASKWISAHPKVLRG